MMKTIEIFTVLQGDMQTKQHWYLPVIVDSKIEQSHCSNLLRLHISSADSHLQKMD
jgi:hypothetical protein